MHIFNRAFFDLCLAALGMSFDNYLKSYNRSPAAFKRWATGRKISSNAVELIAYDLGIDWKKLVI